MALGALARLVDELGARTSITRAREMSELLHRLDVQRARLEQMRRFAACENRLNVFGFQIEPTDPLYAEIYALVEGKLCEDYNKILDELETKEILTTRPARRAQAKGF